MKENKDFKLWCDYYKKNSSSLVKFSALLNVADKAWLFRENTMPYDDVSWELMPPRGFLETDFNLILKSLVTDEIIPKDELFLSQTRIAMALYAGVHFKGWIDFFGLDNVTLVFARALLEGGYEEFGIPFEKLVVLALKFNLLEKDEFFGVALMRGNVLKKRYPTDSDELTLNSIVKKNKRKVLIQEKIYKYI